MLMHAHGGGAWRAGHDEDVAQQSVLAVLLDAHPGQRSVDEVVLELCGGRDALGERDEFGERDLVENAIRELVGAGLLHRHGAFLFATRAAVRFDELLT
jgi:hypothetical protein